MRIKSRIVATWAVVICLAMGTLVALAAVSGVKTVATLVGMEPPAIPVAEPLVRAAAPARDVPAGASAIAWPAPAVTDDVRANEPRDEAALPRAPTPAEAPAVGLAARADAAGGTPGAAAPRVAVNPLAAAGAGGDSARQAQAVAEPEPCGAALCPVGQVCCNASCGTCTAPGEKCSQLVCGMAVTPGSVSCGSNTCNVGEICCNASCGVCALPGAACDATKRCDNAIQYPESPACGMSTCNVGLVCCNPSCGICAPPGEPCSQRTCS